MLLSSLLALLAAPLLAFAQSSGSGQPQQTVITSTTLSTAVVLGPDRQASTSTRTLVFTTTQVLTPAPQPSSNTTNSTVPAGNSTGSASTTTTPSNLPTAPTNVDGGGANAPSPGQTGVGGIYGPDDNYIAAASSLKRNVFVVGFASIALGGAMIAF